MKLDIDMNALKDYGSKLQPFIIIAILFASLALGIYISLKNTHDIRNNPFNKYGFQIGGYIVIGLCLVLLLVGLGLLMQ